MYHNIFIHSSVDEHLRCFHVLAVVNSAAMNTRVHGSFQTMFFSGYVISYILILKEIVVQSTITWHLKQIGKVKKSEK